MSEALINTDRCALLVSDCLSALRGLADACVDSVVTDPPYELGFMGKAWDGTGIAYSVELWREVLRVLKPGGHLLAFGGTRTYHRMTCAIEDAGFEIRDSLHWMYGTGFPKSLNVGEGRGTALKPAHEPIVLARKPLIGTVAANVAAHGTGALNVDGCRIATDDALVRPAILRTDNAVLGKGLGAGRQDEPGGRWPANVLLDEEAAAELDAQSGTRKSGARKAGTYAGLGYMGAEAWDLPAIPASAGGASRFFYVAKPSRAERDRGCEALPPKTAGEATEREEGTEGLNNPRAGAGRTGGARNYHPTVKPIALMRWLCRLVTPPGGTVLDPFLGSGTTGIAALEEGFSFFGIEREAEYAEIAKARLATAEAA